MNERVRIPAKKPDAKRENRAFQTRKTDLSQSINSPVDRILFLQRTIGNQAVQRLIKSGAFRAKFRISQPGDVYEQEADMVTEHVMRMPEPQAVSNGTLSIQMACPTCEEDELRRQPIEEEEELQAKATSGYISEVNPDIESHLQNIRGGGQPLSQSECDFFEPRFGSDFSQVRLHTDTRAAEVAQAMNARAFTVGRDVVFGAGQYEPGTSKGKRLLAHELMHVVQQSVENTSIPANRILRYPEVKIETGVKICYVPLAVFPEWLPSWASPVDHAFIEFDDGWSAGFTMLEGESKEDARIIPPEPRRNDPRKTCYDAERKDSAECQAKPSSDIKRCIQTEAGKDPGRYHFIWNNCGDWVKRTFNNCCLKPKTPGHIY